MSRAALPKITRSLVRKLVDTQFPQFAQLPLQRFPGEGTDNAIYRLGEDFSVRLPRVDWAADTAPLEQAVLGIFQDLPLEVPQPIGLGKPAFGYPWRWSVAGWLQGKPLGLRQLSTREAEDLAETILAIRARPADDHFQASAVNNWRGGPLKRRDRQFRTALQTLSDELDPVPLLNLWERALAVRAGGERVWLHGDLHGGNLLQRGGRLTALIDWGLAGVGDGACDLSAAWVVCDHQNRPAFRAALCPSDEDWLRGAAWALSIGCIYTASYRTMPGISCAMSRRTIEAVRRDFA